MPNTQNANACDWLDLRDHSGRFATRCVAGPWTDAQLASGYIDLVAVEDSRVDVIDFKTDVPSGPVEQTYPKYAGQVRIYGKLLETVGILKDRNLRCGLLSTADGSTRWVDA